MNQEDIKKQLAIIDSIRDKDIDYSDSSDLGDYDWRNFRLLKPGEIDDFIDRHS